MNHEVKTRLIITSRVTALFVANLKKGDGLMSRGAVESKFQILWRCIFFSDFGEKR